MVIGILSLMFRNIFSKKGKVIAVGLKILQTLLIVMHIYCRPYNKADKTATWSKNYQKYSLYIKWQVMKEQKTQRTQLLVFGQYKRANKQHIQSSKNINKSWSRRNNWAQNDSKNTTSDEATHTIKTARQDIMYKSKQAIISGAGCV